MINFFGCHLRKYAIIKGIIDFILIFSSFFIYHFLGLESSGGTTPTYISPLLLVLLTSFLVWGTLFSLGLYDVAKRNPLRNTLARVIVAFFFSSFFTTLLWWSVDFEYVNSLYVPIIAIAIQLCVFLASRVAYQYILPDNFSQEAIVVIAEGEKLERIKNITKQTKQKFLILKQISPSKVDASIEDFCIHNDVSRIILGEKIPKEFLPILGACRLSGIEILNFSMMQERYLGKIKIDNFYSDVLLFTHNFAIGYVETWLKRCFDIIMSLTILIFTFPLTLPISLLIWLEDRHNIFYSQKRVGKRGKIFNVYKLRSMRINAEQNGAVWASQNDPRITKIGNFIRRTRIDEIPQCINILRGEMSLVGPRPERPEFVEKLQKEIPLYDERHLIKPGLTGWAQINEKYGASSEDALRKLEYDLYYLKHHNLVLDMVILLRTLAIVFFPKI